MMSKLLLTTHWTASEAEIILAFLDELRDVILVGYEVELSEACQLDVENHEDTEKLPRDRNDKTPF
jgi:hypothetical protein